MQTPASVAPVAAKADVLDLRVSTYLSISGAASIKVVNAPSVVPLFKGSSE